MFTASVTRQRRSLPSHDVLVRPGTCMLFGDALKSIPIFFAKRVHTFNALYKQTNWDTAIGVSFKINKKKNP